MRPQALCEEIYKELSNGMLNRYQSEAKSRYILYGVKEQNLPRYAANLDESLNHQVYLYISIGLDFFEHGDIGKSEDCFERAGTIMEYINRDKAHQNVYSQYGLLISALSYYCAGQISKSYVIAKEISNDLPIGLLVQLWLHKDFDQLQKAIELVMAGELEDTTDAVKTFARCYSKVIAFIQHGDFALLDSATQDMEGLRKDALKQGAIDLWIVCALMAHILKRLKETSLWTHIPKLGENKEIIEAYIHNLFYAHHHAFELFKTQIEALDVLLRGEGAVISLPTSSGKTRIAELAILKAQMADPDSAVLYLAPFRSLAYEVETNFGLVFAPLHINVSHLYGDNDFTERDASMMAESSIWIATPEKAKVIFRYGGFKKRISLVVLDEGHLIDKSTRYVVNEMFIEELRSKIQADNGQFLVLSAVLPNAQDMSRWLTNSEENQLVSDWQLSTQRTGLIVNYPAKIELEWDPYRTCFNPNFIVESLNGDDTCARVAKRFYEFGSVLLFVGQAQDIERQAAALYQLVEHEPDVDWTDETSDWERFELICNEDTTSGNILKYARKGILCHSGALADSLRFSMERLLRKGKDKARYIIATSTLAQGVNIGVTSVVFASVDYSYRSPINKRDFWNVAGRAGRAFSDTEGRILYYVKATAEWEERKNRDQAWEYMADKRLDNVKSGVLSTLQEIAAICEENELTQEQTDAIMKRDAYPEVVGDWSKIQTDLDLLDDSMLSIILEKESNEEEIENYIDTTLAMQQAKEQDKAKLRRMLAARYRRNMQYTINDQTYFTCTGLSLATSTYLFEQIDTVHAILRTYCDSEQTAEDLLAAVDQLEDIVLGIPSTLFKKVPKEHLNQYRTNWFNGIVINHVRIGKKIKDFYKTSMPWALNALSGYYTTTYEDAEIADAIMRISTCVGLGIASYWACRIYTSGVESRKASMELAERLADRSHEQNKYIRNYILREAENIGDISETTKAWLDVLRKEEKVRRDRVKTVPQCVLEVQDYMEPILYVFKSGEKFYVRNADYSYVREIDPKEYDMNQAAGIMGVYYRKTDAHRYALVSDDEQYKIE